MNSAIFAYSSHNANMTRPMDAASVVDCKFFEMYEIVFFFTNNKSTMLQLQVQNLIVLYNYENNSTI